MVKKGNVIIEFERMYKNNILNDAPTIKLVNNKAAQIALLASELYDADGYDYKPARAGYASAHTVVFTDDLYAMRSNAKHNTLLKAMNMVK